MCVLWEPPNVSWDGETAGAHCLIVEHNAINLWMTAMRQTTIPVVWTLSCYYRTVRISSSLNSSRRKGGKKPFRVQSIWIQLNLIISRSLAVKKSGTWPVIDYSWALHSLGDSDSRHPTIFLDLEELRYFGLTQLKQTLSLCFSVFEWAGKLVGHESSFRL